MSLRQSGQSIVFDRSSLNLKSSIKSFKDIADQFPKIHKKNDDIIFAENDSKHLNNQIERSRSNKIKIWERSPNKDDPYRDNVNVRKKITEIRKNAKESDVNIVDVLENKTKFLTKDHIDIIKEANQIMKERSKNSGLLLSTKNNSIYDFILQNREICLKNFLIDLLKNERTSIAGKQEKITKALSDSEKKLENDYKEFMMYMDNEKNITKRNEQLYFEKVTKNKVLSDRKKKLTQENKQIQDEIVRQVSIIINYKTYAMFIHKVMNDKSYKFSSDNSAYDSKTEDFSEAQTKDFEKVVEKILEEFKYIKLGQSNDNMYILKDISKMSLKFQELEENILKLMDKKQNIDKDFEKLQKNNKKEIEVKISLNQELGKRERVIKDDKSKYSIENDKDERFITQLKKQKSNESSNNEILEMIRELHETAMGIGRKNENEIEDLDPSLRKQLLKKKSDNNYIKELTQILKIMESKIINNISDLEKCYMEEPELLESLVTTRKNLNRDSKIKAQKAKQDQEEYEKMIKAKERMNRVVIKGKNTIKTYLVNKEKKKVENLDNDNKENDERNMIFYETNEFNS